MQLLLTRKFFSKHSTVGQLSIDGKFVCFILEDTDRDINMDGDLNDSGESKDYGVTAIPYQEDEIVLEKTGTIYERYNKPGFWSSKGFPEMEELFQGMLMLKGINGFSRVHIHIGNKVEDTLGCLLTGSNADLKHDPFTVSASTAAYVKLYKQVIPHLLAKEKVTIKIIKGEK